MSDYTPHVLEALGRLKRGEAMTDRDRAIIEPMLHQAVESERIPFVKTTDGYLVGHKKLPIRRGLAYVHQILQRREVRAIDVVATCLQAGDPATDDSTDLPHNPGSNFKGVGMSLPKQDLVDWRTIRAVRAQMRELQSLDTAEAYEQLEALQEILGAATFKGKSRGFVTESEKARQSVTQAIRYSLRRLVDDPETQEIGQHLRKHIKTGWLCSYDGTWKWKF